jgi:hypothetical protein
VRTAHSNADALAVSFNQLPLPEYLVRFSLQFLARCFSTRMRLHVWIKPIELFYAELAGGFGFYGGAEFLKMQADAVQCEAGFAIRTYDSAHRAPRFISLLKYSRFTSPCLNSVKLNAVSAPFAAPPNRTRSSGFITIRGLFPAGGGKMECSSMSVGWY